MLNNLIIPKFDKEDKDFEIKLESFIRDLVYEVREELSRKQDA